MRGLQDYVDQIEQDHPGWHAWYVPTAIGPFHWCGQRCDGVPRHPIVKGSPALLDEAIAAYELLEGQGVSSAGRGNGDEPDEGPVVTGGREGCDPMTDSACRPVSVSRTIEAPAHKLFDFLIHPANHPLIDGSGMLREGSAGVISGVGDVFTMKMHNDEMGDYEMANHIVEYVPDRRIGWEPVLTAASRPEDQADIGDRAEHRWSYELMPLGATSTLVTETYDCSQAPEWLRKAVKGGARWVDSMTTTLEKLEAVSRG